MDEAEWLACIEPNKMLKRARFRSSKRKSRLFAVACCRCIWALLIDQRSRAAVEIAERHADGAASDEELTEAARVAHVAHDELFRIVGKVGSSMEWAAAYAAHDNPFHGAKNATWMASTPRFLEVRRSRPGDHDELQHFPCTVTIRRGLNSVLLGKWKVTTLNEPVPTGAEPAIQAALIRCIFGNPFRTVTLNPAWQTREALSLAQAAYDNRLMPAGTLDLERLRVLADALEEAGCDNAEILEHLRGPEPHFRGCFALDLILTKQ